MASKSLARARSAIYGALVADAAALGLHWIYDQDHIRQLAPDTPEFRTPSASDYQGVPGYFAHASRHVGDQSQYGEQSLVMLKSLAANNGQFDVNHYAMSFRAHFGYGGAYVGYIDHATRETLDNFTRAEESAQSNAKAIPFDGDASVTTAMVIKAFSINNQFNGEEAKLKFEEAVRITHDNDQTVKYGLKILAQLQATPAVVGANDEQFPATAKLPPLIALTLTKNTADLEKLSQQVEAAIKVTNSHERALSYGIVSAKMMEAAVSGNIADGILQAGLAASDNTIKTDINTALSMGDKSVMDVTKHYGMACDLKFGIPSIAHNIKHTSSYSEAIRNNIYAGGDSCGRAMILGAIVGGLYGVGGENGIPEAWIERLTIKEEVEQLISS